jgi:hypothetical protein
MLKKNLYIGVQQVKAAPMTRQEYNDFRGWQLPANEIGGDEGYLVEPQGRGTSSSDADSCASYVTWIPKALFDQHYLATVAMSFGLAIEALKQGKKVARIGWNGKGMWLRYIHPYAPHPDNCPDATLRNPYFKAWDNNEEAEGTMLPWIGMKTADNGFVPWLASQTDMLAEDWLVIE